MNKEKKNTELNSNTKSFINEIPLKLREYRKNNNMKELTPEEYTKRIFKMTEKFSFIKDEDLNVNKIEKPIVKEIKNLYEKTFSENERRNIFDNFISSKENTEKIIVLGNIYTKKNTQKKKENLEKTHSPFVKKEQEETINAIENNAYPIMIPKTEINYITNPLTNSIYKGNNQIALQRYNLMNGLSETQFVPMADLYKNGGGINPANYKTKALIISNGKNSNGQNVYSLLVPVKATFRDRLEEKKLKKEELRRNKFDAEYIYRNGKKPEYISIGINTEQKPVKNFEQIQIENSQVKENATFEDIIKKDTEAYFYSLLAKTPYVPTVDYTKEPYKTKLINFVKENPEKIIKMNNETYTALTQQTKTKKIENIQKDENNVQEIEQLQKKKGRGRQ